MALLEVVTSAKVACGFHAGDPRLVVPRRETPRTMVPTGAVGLAGGYSGIYPRASPGGRQLIGRTDAVPWDLTGNPLPCCGRAGGCASLRWTDEPGGVCAPARWPWCRAVGGRALPPWA